MTSHSPVEAGPDAVMIHLIENSQRRHREAIATTINYDHDIDHPKQVLIVVPPLFQV